MGKVLTNGQAGRPRVRGCALASVSILSLAVMSVAAKAQPAGGSVVAGQAQISAAGATTLINQSTSKAIISELHGPRNFLFSLPYFVLEAAGDE